MTVTCPTCEATLNVPDSAAGKRGKCPRCQGVVVIPGPPAAATAVAPAPVTSRRTYLFERRYRRFRARLAAVATRFLAAARAIWRWCWSGPGAHAIEIGLRVAIILAGLGVAGWYIRYENAQGHPTSSGVLFTALLIAVVIWVSLLGWKVPAHLAARVCSGLAAAGTVAAVGVAAVAAVGLLSVAYVLLTLVLTALSVVVFVPMRGSQTAWLLYRRIAYVCPYDDCTFTGLPIHLCTCGARYPDLLPSFHGLFHHTCTHPDGDVKLPTLDALGRAKLPRLCGGCQRPLVLSSVGELPVWPLAVVGGTSAGKSVFLRQAARELIRELGETGEAGPDSADQKQQMDADLRQLDRGQVLAKTAGDVMQALGLAVRQRKPGRLRCLLYLYDAPGEVFTTMQRFGQKQHVLHLSGLVLLVDPFGLPGLAGLGDRVQAGVNPSQDPLHDLVGNLIHRVGAVSAAGPGGKCDLPLAVVVGKCDALPAGEAAGLDEAWPAPGRPADPRAGDRCREALVKLGAGHSVRALEQRFETVRYFACSALGRVPDRRDPRPFRPAGVAEPFRWLIDQIARHPHFAAARGRP